MMTAEADGLKAILTRKAAGFQEIVKAAEDQAELAALLLITEQLPALVEAQVKAISNLKIDQITVWEGGRKDGGRTSTADFLSGMVGALPPLHELTKNVGIDLPQYLGKVSERLDQAGAGATPPSGPAADPA
jgi:flotillin